MSICTLGIPTVVVATVIIGKRIGKSSGIGLRPQPIQVHGRGITGVFPTKYPRSHCCTELNQEQEDNVDPALIINEPLLQLFKWEHLPENLQKISKPFGELAIQIVETLPRNPERSTSLRKLREAKDAAVTAYLWK